MWLNNTNHKFFAVGFVWRLTCYSIWFFCMWYRICKHHVLLVLHPICNSRRAWLEDCSKQTVCWMQQQTLHVLAYSSYLLYQPSKCHPVWNTLWKRCFCFSFVVNRILHFKLQNNNDCGYNTRIIKTLSSK